MKTDLCHTNVRIVEVSVGISFNGLRFWLTPKSVPTRADMIDSYVENEIKSVSNLIADPNGVKVFYHRFSDKASPVLLSSTLLRQQPVQFTLLPQD